MASPLRPRLRSRSSGRPANFCWRSNRRGSRSRHKGAGWVGQSFLFFFFSWGRGGGVVFFLNSFFFFWGGVRCFFEFFFFERCEQTTVSPPFDNKNQTARKILLCFAMVFPHQACRHLSLAQFSLVQSMLAKPKRGNQEDLDIYVM